jgi:hypothetical protein
VVRSRARSSREQTALEAREIVLRALEVVNLSLGRAVTAKEVARAIPPECLGKVRLKSPKDLPSQMSVRLKELMQQGLVFSAGKKSARHFYASARVADPSKITLPPGPYSCCQKVLAIVRRLTGQLGRGVRMDEILTGATAAELNGMTRSSITQGLGALVQRKSLGVIGVVRGRARNVYLPMEFDPKAYVHDDPVTPLDKVLDAFWTLWRARLQQAQEAGVRPQPLTTGEISVQFQASNGRLLGSARCVATCLGILQSGMRTRIRCVRRGHERARLWAPIDFAITKLDVDEVYASDAERAREAVRRASERLGRPVRSAEAAEEVAADRALRPRGPRGFQAALQEGASRTKVTVTRGQSRIIKVGTFHGRAYWSAGSAEEGRAFIRFKQLAADWRRGGFVERFRGLQECALDTVAIGRALQVLAEASSVTSELRSLILEPVVPESPRSAAQVIVQESEKLCHELTRWLAPQQLRYPDLPVCVSPDAPGWTSNEVIQALGGLYPPLDRLAAGPRIASLISMKIRRVSNARYQTRWSQNPVEAASMLFDKTDALISFAIRCGGRECAGQAALAKHELDRLRDDRFVIPSVCIGNWEKRLVGVACLAFLWSERGTKALREIAVADQDPGVRQAALWGYGFSGGEGAIALAEQRMRSDCNSQTREFASRVLDATASNQDWWSV